MDILYSYFWKIIPSPVINRMPREPLASNFPSLGVSIVRGHELQLKALSQSDHDAIVAQ